MNKKYSGFKEDDYLFFTKDGKRIHGVVIELMDDLFQNMLLVQDAETYSSVEYTVPSDICERACDYCGGWGYVIEKAQQKGGSIIDEKEYPCIVCGGNTIIV